MSELPSAKADEYVERARPHYQVPGPEQPDALPYHNWGHAVDVYWQADELAQRSRKRVGAQVNRSLLLVAAAWHDAGYHLPLDGFPTREYRSAALARQALLELSEVEQDIIASSIIDTTVNKQPKSNHQGIALHFADVGYMAAGNYELFLDSLSKMRQEWGSPSWDDTIARTTSFARDLIDEAETDLSQILTAEDLEVWVARVESNIAMLQAGRGL